MQRRMQGMVASVRSMTLLFVANLKKACNEGEMTTRETRKELERWKANAIRRFYISNDIGMARVMSEVIDILNLALADLEWRTDDRTVSRWYAGTKMDNYSEGEDNRFLPEAELCTRPENRNEEFETPPVWFERLDVEQRQTGWDLRDLDQQFCFRFCQQANRVTEYRDAVKLAREWGSHWAKKNIRNWEFWARARNYLNAVVWAKFPQQAMMREDFWQDKSEKKNFGRPANSAPRWMWESFLRQLETSEDDVMTLNAEGLLESIEGVGEKRAKALLDAFEGESVFDADFQDLLEIDGIGPVTAFKVYGGPLAEVEPEKWVPSQAYLESDPVGTYSIPEEEKWDLLGDQNQVRTQGFCMAPESILAWIGDLRK